MEYNGYEQFLTVLRALNDKGTLGLSVPNRIRDFLGLKEGDNVKIMIKKAEKPEEQKKEVD